MTASFSSLSGTTAAEVASIADYPREASSKEDYYAEGGAPSQWVGGGCHALGLAGGVERGDVINAMQGKSTSGADLVPGAGPDRRYGTDMTFSAPKSISSIWAVADPALKTKIEQAQATAVATAIRYIEDDFTLARRGKGGIEKEHAKLIAACYLHGTSREKDPQLHTHAVLINLCVRQDGSFGAIDAREVYSRKMEIGAAYRAELAGELSKMGFKIESDADSFRVTGVPKSVEKEFSTRRQQILESLAKSGFTGGKAAEIAALKSRKDKEIGDSTLLRQDWKDRAARHGLTVESIVEIQQLPQNDKKPFVAADALDTLTQNRAILSHNDLKRAGMVAAQTEVGGIEQGKALAEELRSSAIRLVGLDGKTYYTTQKIIEAEKNILAVAEARTQVSAPTTAQVAAAIAATPTLSLEQKIMVEHVTSTNQMSPVEGDAGTGKSFALGVANAAWVAVGKEVIGCALAGKAADSLQDGSGIQSQTLHSLLSELDSGTKVLSGNSVIVLDEAGMVGVHQMNSLVNKVKESGAKLVLVGDSKQLQPVEAGAPFRQICQKIGAAILTDIRRQVAMEDREDVKAFARGDAAKALANYREQGRLKIETTRAGAMTRMVSDYLKNRDPQRVGESLMIAATRADARKLNDIARAQLSGKLGPGAQVETPAGSREFREGDRVLFTRNSKDLQVKNGTLGTLQRVETDRSGTRFKVALDTGKTVEFAPGADWKRGQYADIDHGYAVTAHKSQGVTVDRSYTLAPEAMGSREWAYVALSRHRIEANLYASQDQIAAEKGVENTITIDQKLSEMLAVERQAAAASDMQQAEEESIINNEEEEENEYE
ncbi:MAG: MobF family relaxase [Acidithiobacillus sp.]